MAVHLVTPKGHTPLGLGERAKGLVVFSLDCQAEFAQSLSLQVLKQWRIHVQLGESLSVQLQKEAAEPLELPREVHA